MNLKSIKQLAGKAKAASETLATVSSKTKDRALTAMARALLKHQEEILKANAKDVRTAKKKGLPESLISRLALDTTKIKKIVDSLSSIAKLPDPVGRLISTRRRPNGLVIKKIVVPIRVILIIY